ncbi:MAG: LysR family transcriptional regulator [Deltaproteobacteria bacterium]|nr:LysR family transcriptional regulator [Deltaproteobacteria bacterium]
MNLKQLEVFLAVAETGSFSRAAEATFITQSTVSQHISSLEAEFDLKLLDRTGKGVFPTQGGKILLEHARQILSQAKEVPLAMKRFKGLEEASVKIGVSNIPGNYIIPAALPYFIDRYPGVTLTILEGDSQETMDRLKKEEIEIGIIGTLFDEEDIDFKPLGRDKIVLVVKGNHPWAGRKSINLNELLNEKFIIREAGSGTEKTVREALVRASIEPSQMKVRASLGSNEAVKQAVVNGIGAAFISQMSIRKELTQGEVAIVKVKGLTISRCFFLISRLKRDLSPPARAFAHLLQDMYREGP